MGVGDVTSDERGSGARNNDGKANWAIMPLGQVSDIHHVHVRSLAGAGHMSPLRVWRQLAMFQEGERDACRLLEVAVAYNWHTQGGPTTMDIFESLHNVIRVWELGADKYAPMNWMKGTPWSVPIGCMARHTIEDFRGDTLDAESGELHSAHIVCNAQMLYHYEEYYQEGDDRPTKWFETEPGGYMYSEDLVEKLRQQGLDNITPMTVFRDFVHGPDLAEAKARFDADGFNAEWGPECKSDS